MPGAHVSRRLCYLGPQRHEGEVAAALGDDWQVVRASSDDEVDAVLGDCDAVLDALMRVRFDGARLARSSRLRLISSASTGTDHIDAEACAERGVALESIAGRDVTQRLSAAAEHTWGLVLALARRTLPAVESVRDGTWRREDFPGMMLRGRSLGVIGCGRIGRWVAGYGQAFGMHVRGFDPLVDPWPGEIERVDDLAALAAASDVLCIHVPLSKATVDLVGSTVLAAVKPGTLLVNTSRGEIVDDSALLAALGDGRLAGAATDVLRGEPHIVDHPLVVHARTHDHLLITPHIGGFSPDAVALVLTDCCERVHQHFGTTR